MTDRFIDHDDKIPAPTLSSAFEWTSKTYQTMFHEVYSECTCWYCEAVRECHSSVASRHVFHRSTYKGIEDSLSVLDQSSAENTRPMPHISAHNAVDCPTDPKVALAAHNKKQALDMMFEKALKRAEKKGRPGLSSVSLRKCTPVTPPVRHSWLARSEIAAKEHVEEV
ncbi:MAG: hypothetical protein Q9186_002551 [Xanthomendoza sp. 1 TL-2023]